MGVIAIHAERQPERAPPIEGERRLSGRELRDVRNRLAHSLVALGLRPGEPVVIHAYNCLEAVIDSAAVRAAGGITVPMNHRLTAEEVAPIRDDSEAEIEDALHRHPKIQDAAVERLLREPYWVGRASRV